MISTNIRDEYVFAPVIEPVHDDAFLTNMNYELLSTGQFNRVPQIIGYNSLEGYFDSLGKYFASH